MPTFVTHAVVGLVAARIAARRGAPARFWVLSAGVSMLPDADALGFAFGLADHTWSHRGFSHSLAFAALSSALVVGLAFRRGWRPAGWGTTALCAYFAALMASHGILDAFTNGGEGIELLWPFSDRRVFWPVHPIRVAPLRAEDFFSAWGLRVLWSEARYVWLPALALLAAVEVRRARGRRAAHPRR